MKRIAVFPGSFDPITKGHEDIILRALPLFDKIIVAIGENADKKGFFSLEKRLAFLRKTFHAYPSIQVRSFHGLTVDFCQETGAHYILRGLRTSADFEFERTIGQVNKKMVAELETIFMLTKPEFTPINSSVVREILRHKGDPSPFVPEAILHELD